MEKLARLTIAALFVALPAMAPAFAEEPEQETRPRSREAADASLELDAAAVEALRFEAERLEQAAREVLSAPGARSNGAERLAASLALGAASHTLADAVEDLAAADAAVARALDQRARARKALDRKVDEITSDTTFALAPVAGANSVLDGAAQSAAAALALADSWSDRLLAGDRLQIDIVFATPLDPEAEDAAAIAAAFETLFSELVASGAVSLRPDGVIIEGRYPEGVSVRDIRSLVEARLFDPGSPNGLAVDVPAPLMIIIERVPAHLSYEPDADY